MNEWLPLASVPKVKPGRGGPCRVFAIPIEDCSVFPDLNPATQTITANIQLVPGKDWLFFELTNPSKVFKEEGQVNAAVGLFYNQTVSGLLTGQDIGNHVTVENLTRHRFIVICIERTTGITYLVGKPKAGAFLSVKYESKTNTNTELVFALQSRHRAYIYEGLLPDEVIAGNGLIDSTNEELIDSDGEVLIDA